jgi:hypothetical protein
MDNKKYLLPYGDSLRDFLNDSRITKSDLRTIIRQRGIFTLTDEKSEQIPVLVRTGITPSELLELSEKVWVKEENPKIHTQTIKCAESSTPLKAMIPTGFNVAKIVDKPFSNYRLLGIPSFKTVDGNPNNMELSFTIERFDYSKSWDKNSTQFSGKVIIKKTNGSVDMNIALSHSSHETKEVAHAITKKLINEMKVAGHIAKGEEIKRILFSDFTNENRVNFLKKVSREQISNELFFIDTKDIGFSPDSTQLLPEDISWMQTNISNLILQGEGLHSTFFVKDKKYHKCIKMHMLEASYTFAYSGFDGTCNIVFEFPEFSNKKDEMSELSIRVSSLRFNEKGGASLSKVKELLLSQLEESKLKYYDLYSISDLI